MTTVFFAMSKNQEFISHTCICDGETYSNDKPIPLESVIIFSTYDADVIGHWTVTAKSAENEDILISGNASSGPSNNYILDTSSINLAKLKL